MVEGGNAQAVLKWTAMTGALAYNVYYGTTPDITASSGAKITGATSGNAITGLTNGATYYFVVTAVNSHGESAASSVVSATLTAAPPFKFPKNALGINTSGFPDTQMSSFAESDLPGIAKMGGIWASALNYAQFIEASTRFCSFAKAKNQQTIIQLPLQLKSQIDAVLSHLASLDCNLVGVSIDNEASRLTVELPSLFTRYTVQNYIADVQYIAPKIRSRLPKVSVIALDLISFTTVEGEDPIAMWLSPFCSAIGPTGLVDYVSIHYYAYNGAQKEWQNLNLGKQIQGYFAPAGGVVPASCPPILLGEFNTTFQFTLDTVYPGSGGESFMGALTIPEIFAIPQVEGLIHWSIIDSSTSTLGLYDMAAGKFKPYHSSYQLMKSVVGANRISSQFAIPDVAITSFQSGGQTTSFVGNYSPFFKRSVELSNGANGVTAQQTGINSNSSVDLAPFSLSKITFNPQPAVVGRFSYADRTTRSGPFNATERSNQYCAKLADFAEPIYTGQYFIGSNWNQNRKIATGGTPSTLAQSSWVRNASAADISCAPNSACGIKFPFTADTDPIVWKDWSEAYTNGVIRITMATPQAGNFKFSLHAADRTSVGWNDHAFLRSLAQGSQTIDLPIAQFVQASGSGIAVPLRTALQKISSFGIESIDAAPINFSVSSIELCDRL